MYALHDLLNRDARVLNRNARKMYGFVPGLITAVTDPKQKRHQKGYVKVCFPGLQDVDGPDAPILPWARLLTQNAGGMIEPHKTEKKKFQKQIWERKPREISYEMEVETDEPVFDEIEEETEEPVKDVRTQTFQDQLTSFFKGDRPSQYEGETTPNGSEFSNDVWEKGSSGAKVLAQAQKLVTEAKKALKDTTDDSELIIYVDGHTTTSGMKGDQDKTHELAERRVRAAMYYLDKAFRSAEDLRGKVKFITEGWGWRHAGEMRDVKAPLNWKRKPGSLDSSFNDRGKGRYINDGTCRRLEVTFDFRGVKYIKKTKVTKKKVQIGVKKVLKKVKGTRTVYDTTSKIIEVEIDVPVPGKPSGTGIYTPPQIGDEVLCAFEHGDMHFPYVLGSLWNGKAKLPEPSTPADDKRDKKGPSTPSMKGDSLSGGGGKNKIGYFKSRTGNLLSLDDATGVVRAQDRGGMSTFQLSKGKIEFIQSSGNIFFFAAEKVRIDCKDMIVNAQNDIWQHATGNFSAKAGANQTINAKKNWVMNAKGAIKYMSGADTKLGADKMVAITAKGGGGVSLMAGAGIGMSSKDDQFDLDAKGNVMITTAVKVAFGADADLSLKADGMINMNGLANIKWKGSEALLNSGGAPPGALTLGSIIGAVIRGAKALAGAIASGASAAASAVASAAKSAAAAAGQAVSAAASALGKVVGAVTSAVNSAASAVAGAARAVANAAVRAGQAVASAAQNVVNSAVNVARNAANAVADTARRVGETVVNTARQAANAVANTAQQVAHAAQEAVSAVGAAAQNLAQQAQQAGQAVVNEIRDAGQAALDGARNVADRVVEAGQNAVQQVQNGVQQLANGVQGAVDRVQEAGANAVGAVREGIDRMEQAGERAVGAVQNAANQFADGVNNAVNEVGQRLDNAAGEVRDMANQAVEGAGQAVQDARNAAADAVEGAGQAAGRAIRGDGNGVPAEQQAQNGTGRVAQGADFNMGHIEAGADQAAGGGAGAAGGAAQAGAGAAQAGVGAAQAGGAAAGRPARGAGQQQLDWRGLPAPQQIAE